MSAEYSAEEVMQYIEQMGNVISPRGLTYLRAYAERIEADERAAPACWSLRHRDGTCALFADCMYDNEDDARNDAFALNGESGQLVPVPLFTHPPAQAAQVDKPPRLGGCCCGEPCTLGVVHRTDGPCFVYEQPADSGRVADASAEDRFEQYVKTLIDHAPDVQKLGERLAHLLDDDQFNNIEPTLLGIAAALAAQGQDWRIGMFDRWNEAAQEKGYAGICEAINSVPAASPAGVPDVVKGIQRILGSVRAFKSAGFDRAKFSVDELEHQLAEILAAAPSAPEGDGGEG